MFWRPFVLEIGLGPPLSKDDLAQTCINSWWKYNFWHWTQRSRSYRGNEYMCLVVPLCDYGGIIIVRGDSMFVFVSYPFPHEFTSRWTFNKVMKDWLLYFNLICVSNGAYVYLKKTVLNSWCYDLFWRSFYDLFWRSFYTSALFPLLTYEIF